MRNFLFIFIILFGLLLSVKSQNLSLKFQHLTVNDGLSQNTVKGIVQDKYGFIWIGTQCGLNRYNGYDFRVFKHDALNPNSISDNYILSLFIDSNENLWIGTESGLNRYDFKTERFIKYLNKSKKDIQIENNCIKIITESKATPGLLWIGTNYNICSFDIKTEVFIDYQLPFIDSLQHLSLPIQTIFESSNELGTLWIGTLFGLIRFNTKSGTFTHYGTKEGLSSNCINYIYEDSQRTLWIGTNKGLNAFNKKTERFITYKYILKGIESKANINIQTIFEDIHNKLWIGTLNNGLNLFNRENKHFKKWVSQQGNTMSISNNNVSEIFEDQSGILWVCTVGKGLNKLNPNYENFGYIYYDQGNPNSLISNSVRSCYIDNKNLLWVGTTNGISIFDEETGTYEHLIHDPNNLNSLSNNNTSVVYQTKDGIFWFGLKESGLDRYDANKKTFKHYNYNKDIQNPNSIGGNYVRAIYEDKDGILWIGTVSGGLNRFDPATETFKHYYYEKDNPKSLNDNRVYAIFEDSKGFFWIGTARGIAKFDPKTEIFQRYLANSRDKNSLSYQFVMGISEDHLGNIWIATYGGGINKLDPKTGIFKRYTEDDGLPDNAVYIVIEDDENNLWISTNKGISKFDPTTEQFTNFDQKDGLQENEFNSGAYFKSKKGKIYFGGINGLNMFDPKEIKNNEYISPIFITDFKIFNKSILPYDSINGKPILTKSILDTDTIILSHKEDIFSFSYSSIDFSNPEKNEYAYILENYEKEWNKVGTRRYATYTNIPAGEYTFHVIGSYSDDIWNEEGKSIKIIITPPWWKTKLFYFLSILTIVSLILLYIRIRISHLKKEKLILENHVKERTNEIQKKNVILQNNQLELEKQKKEINKHLTIITEVNATKDKFFSIIAHDLKSPFNTIIGFADLLDTDYEDYSDEERKKFINILSKTSKNTFSLLENLLTWARSQRGKIIIKKERLNIKKLVDETILPYSGNASLKNIKIKNNVPVELQIFADKETIKIVISNLINNGIKFTHVDGKISVSAEVKENIVEICIQDNGVGMSKNVLDKLFRIEESFTNSGTNKEKGTGLGLILCKEFVEKNGGKIWAESEVGRGSKFKFTISPA